MAIFWPMNSHLSKHGRDKGGTWVWPRTLPQFYLRAGLAEGGGRQWVSDGAVLTRLFGRRRERQAQVGVVFCVQPPLVLLSAPSHAVQTNPWVRNDRRDMRWRECIFFQTRSQGISNTWKLTRAKKKRHQRNPPFITLEQKCGMMTRNYSLTYSVLDHV